MLTADNHEVTIGDTVWIACLNPEDDFQTVIGGFFRNGIILFEASAPHDDYFIGAERSIVYYSHEGLINRKLPQDF